MSRKFLIPLLAAVFLAAPFGLSGSVQAGEYLHKKLPGKNDHRHQNGQQDRGR